MLFTYKLSIRKYQKSDQFTKILFMFIYHSNSSILELKNIFLFNECTISPNFLSPAQVSLNAHLLLAKARDSIGKRETTGYITSSDPSRSHLHSISSTLTWTHRKTNGMERGHKLLIASISHCYSQQTHRCSPTKTEKGEK